MATSVTPPPEGQVEKSAFETLPDEIIEQILAAADPNAFASLVLVSHNWHSVSQRSHLYRHQLRQCPSFDDASSPRPASAGTSNDDDLPRLRRLFARQVKRGLFDAYLRPRKTTIKLVSTSISSSSCPGGEGMHFSASPRAQLLLAYNSSRIYVVDVRGDTPQVKREFKILRRPVAACIKDDASLLAVLSSEAQVDVYDLTTSPPRRKQAIILDNTPRTIAMSPCGSVLAAAYDGGIEVSSLKPTAVPAEKRSVKCEAVDSLVFSHDGTQILGTTTHSSPPSTVVLTAPYYDPGTLLTDDNIGAMWTTSILFPNSSRDCSHAVLLQEGSQDEASWTFAYDRSFEAFRAVRIDDLRNGTTYFTGPTPSATSQATLLPSTLSGATYNGDLVAAGFHGREIWVYGVPDDLDAVPEAASLALDKRSGSISGTLGRHNSERSNLSRNPSSRGKDPGDERAPQWQLLCDKLRNNLVSGSKISEMAGVTNAKWVAQFGGTSLRERLVITATGVSGPRLVTDEEDFDFADGGRVSLLDFDYALEDGKDSEITMEVGDDDAEVLEEERRDIEAEVAIVRRRTVAQKHGGRTALLRAATSSVRDMPVPVPPIPGGSSENTDEDDDPLVPRRIGQNPTVNQPARPVSPDDPDVATIEEQEAMDAPYTHATPRSAPTLRRAATAAAISQRLRPTLADGRPIEYRRADGRREHPHESDADNWVPPPPPYQKEDPGDLPAFLRGPAVGPMGETPAAGAVPSTEPEEEIQHSQQDNVTAPAAADPPADPASQSAGESATSTGVLAESAAQPGPSTDAPAPAPVDDIYDASPPVSPVKKKTQPVAPVSPETSSTAPQDVPPASQHVPPEVPALHIPPVQPAPDVVQTAPAVPSDSQQSHISRLSSSQTWPLQKTDSSMAAHASEPATNAAASTPGPARSSTIDTSLPPAPTADQLASLNRRISQPNPRRLSGGYRGSLTLGGPQAWQQYAPRNSIPSGTSLNSDQPLIISTPKGISGALDDPEKPTASDSTAPLVAPVPRHPRPTVGILGQRPPVNHLETIYSNSPTQPNHPPQQELKSQSSRWRLAPWRRSQAVNPPGTPVGVGRQLSRAERNAAKNLLNSKVRGWAGKSRPRRSGSRRTTRRQPGHAPTTATGWSDVSVPEEKGQKCVMM